MKKLLTLIAIAFTAACCQTASATNTAAVDAKRAVTIDGAIAGNALRIAANIEKMSRNSNAPIDIVLNSPGGDVMAGLQIIDAMTMAQSRGVRFRCEVPTLAASMAFQIFAHCDERYALRYAMLLWHPMKVTLQDPASSSELKYQHDELTKLETSQIDYLIEQLNISREDFFYYYGHETLWTAENLLKVSPEFLTVVNDMPGVTAPFDLGM